MHDGGEGSLFRLVVNAQVRHETECVLRSQNALKFLGEEFLDDGAVAAQEVKRHRVVMLNRLAHIDDPDFLLMVQQVVLAQIGMHQSASLIHAPHNHDRLQVALVPVLEVGVPEARRGNAILPHELHHDDIVLQEVRIRRLDKTIGLAESL